MSTIAKQKVGEKIVGTWELVSWVFENEQGEEVRFFGQSPKGLLIYQNSGYMSVQIAQENRPTFKSEGIDSGSTEEMASAFATFLSYYGRYVESEPGVFVHTVEGTLFPNWLGHKEVRYADLDGDTLVLSTPPTATSGGDITFKITWRRILK